MSALFHPRQRARAPFTAPSSASASSGLSVSVSKPTHGPIRSERNTGFRILVVDDNRDAADGMAMLINRLGNQVCTAYGGAEALLTFPLFQPDVILLDLAMPGMNGYEVARQIRAMPRGKGALMIALTGFSSRLDRRLSHDAGIDHHSVKPVDAIILQRLIEIQIGIRCRAAQSG